MKKKLILDYRNTENSVVTSAKVKDQERYFTKTFYYELNKYIFLNALLRLSYEIMPKNFAYRILQKYRK